MIFKILYADKTDKTGKKIEQRKQRGRRFIPTCITLTLTLTKNS